jgi:hypothetical protein
MWSKNNFSLQQCMHPSIVCYKNKDKIKISSDKKQYYHIHKKGSSKECASWKKENIAGTLWGARIMMSE